MYARNPTPTGVACIESALALLVSWPALDKAAALVLSRSTEFNGDLYMILTPAAEALAAKHPLAATLLLRTMIGFSLTQSRSSRYRHSPPCRVCAASVEHQ